MLHLPHFDRSAVFQVRMVERAFHRFVITSRFDHVVAAEDFLGLAIRPVGRNDFRPAHDLAAVVHQFVAAQQVSGFAGDAF